MWLSIPSTLWGEGEKLFHQEQREVSIPTGLPQILRYIRDLP